MIEFIKSVLMDFTGLKDSEIPTYINSQLIKYYPEPDKLSYDYIIKSKGNSKSGLVTYTLKQKLVNINLNTLEHPHLVFRNTLKKDGRYIILYFNNILEVHIKSGLFSYVKHSKLNLINISLLSKDKILISDKENIKNLNDVNCIQLLNLESLYKKCKKDLFSIKKRSKITVYIALISVLLLLFSAVKIITIFNDNENKLIKLTTEYNLLLIENNKGSELEDEYNILKDELLIIQSQLPINLYNVFFDLNRYGKDFKILDLSYSNNFIRFNAISKNSIKLVHDLNESLYLDLTQNSTINKVDYEWVNVSGDIICP